MRALAGLFAVAALLGGEGAASAELRGGLSVGLKGGLAFARLPSQGSGYGYAYELTGELTLAGEYLGVLFSLGYGRSHAYYGGGVEQEYGGLSLTAMGMLALLPRVILHAGGGGIYGDEIYTVAGTDATDGAFGYRLVGGVDIALARGDDDRGDVLLRLEGRYQQSEQKTLGDATVAWTGGDVLVQIICTVR